MSGRGKNKAKRVNHMNQQEEWFRNKRKKNRKNKRLVKKSKKRNR